MKKIIVPIDFSKHSEFALKAAALLAKKHNAEIYALHMLDIQFVNLSESESYGQEKAVFFLKMAEKRIKRFLLKDYLKEVKVFPIIQHYKVFSDINSIAKDVNADLIIMSSHGVSGFKEFFVGSNAEKVIRHSELPVLVIKNDLNDVVFKDVVFATSLSDETIEAYKKMLKIVALLEANLHILYVNLPNEDFLSTREMEKKANEFLLEAEGNTNRMKDISFVSDRSIEKGILNFSNLVGADLISVITHGRKGLSHIFAGSISEDITNHSTLPILTFKI
ncbi:universal stress protein UspA [Polaribacter sp. SA4-10]|uniref:universal stress protein n=1 Tax=Polaribacter sp. SA4-10 TaxID=754397 RepID=UPI000B3CA989|nr:universal stress protein [Polaribacter sp. SA4-10]ARV06507.1 universal stress protein UspA [Polaribacter sp. SA4-10]